MLSGNEWNWVWHYKATIGTSETDLVVLTALRDHLDLACNGLEAQMHNSILSTECELFVWDAALNRFDGTAQIAWTTYIGVNAGDPLANQLATLAKAFTAVGRRQGRKYLPGATETALSGNTYTGGFITSILTWATILDNLVPATGVSLSPGVWNVDPLSALFETFEPFANVVAVDSNPSTQRRRKPNVGI